MAINASYPIVEEGQNSPHGEMFRCVYNHTIDACLDQVAAPVGAPLYWDFARLVCDQRPWGRSGSPIPAAPIAATNAAELYAAATGFPITSHQDNQGAVEYAAIGVHQYEDGVEAALTKVGMPAGIVVIANLAGSPNAMTSHWPAEFLRATPATKLDKLYMVKTRGIVQALVDGTTDVAVGDYLEGVAGAYNLILDAANANEGTFIALEARTTNSVDMMWVMLVNIAY